MEAHCINYSQTGFFSQTILRYLDNDPDLRPFYNEEPSIAGFEQRIKTKKITTDRGILVEVLLNQYARISDIAGPDAVEFPLQGVKELKLDNTFTITTGHQLNIFTGPLYFIFKIASAIKLAQQLKLAFPDKNFVPVYWMATEDHDFAEINHTNVNGKKIEWNFDASGATGRLSTKTIRKALNQYKGILGLDGYAPELGQIVETAYTRFDKLADATRYLVNALFGRHGLVVVDADDTLLKKQFAGIIADDITGQHSFKNISQTDAELQKLGVHTQVNPREINFFYLTDELRERIVFDKEAYKVLNTEIQFTEAELCAEIDAHPGRFSPNVVMRPLYQEVILPNLAYIGGGAEVIYWLQLKSNFDYYKVDFPVLILRNSGLLVKKQLADKFQKTGYALTDMFKATESLKNDWVTKNTTTDLTINDEWRDLNCVFERLKLRTHKIDATLSPSTEAIQARLKHALYNLEKKMLKAEKRNYQTSLVQLENIKNELFPKGSLQERSENLAMFYVRMGPKLIDDLIENFEPLDFKFTVLVG